MDVAASRLLRGAEMKRHVWQETAAYLSTKCDLVIVLSATQILHDNAQKGMVR
jgi:hypothetical protein